MSNLGELLSTAQAAKVLGVSVKTVHRLVDRGELNMAVKMDGLRGPMLYTAQDVHALAQKRTAGKARA